MKIQVNSNKAMRQQTPTTHQHHRSRRKSRSQPLRHPSSQVLEIHLSNVDNQKSGRADKRCLVETRPAGDKPMTASATASTNEGRSSPRRSAKCSARSPPTYFWPQGAHCYRDLVPSHTA